MGSLFFPLFSEFFWPSYENSPKRKQQPLFFQETNWSKIAPKNSLKKNILSQIL
jgi:hypothetical protein